MSTKYFDMINYWDKIYTRKTVLLHTGYDYSKTVFKNTISEEMYNSNSFFVGFIDHMNDLFVSIINTVKRIKTMGNIALKKDDITIN